MKRLILAVAAFVAMTSASFGVVTGVTLDYVQNPDPAAGLKSYTVQATGTGINTLGKFTIDGDVYQVWDDVNTPSEWLGDGSADADVLTDSYVIYGDMRMPFPPYNTPVTAETIHSGGVEGLGTLNNCGPSGVEADAYLYIGTPSDTETTVDLLHLVVPDNGSVMVGLHLVTVAYNPVTHVYDLTTSYDFFGDDALRVPVPEPTTLVALAVGALCLAFRRVR